MNRGQQLRYLSEFIYDLADDGEHDLIVMEKPIMGNNRKYSMAISELCGALQSELSFIGETELVDNNKWKKALIGHGNASKPMIAAWLYSTYPKYSALCGEDQDQRDAVCVGLWQLTFDRLITDIATNGLDAELDAVRRVRRGDR